MKIIGAGYGRTGTVSIQQALEHLGYLCYHMQEIMKAYGRGHIELWDKALTGHTNSDWAGLFAGYEATVDFPACVFYKELMDAFPDVFVLLSQVMNIDHVSKPIGIAWQTNYRLRKA